MNAIKMSPIWYLIALTLILIIVMSCYKAELKNISTTEHFKSKKHHKKSKKKHVGLRIITPPINPIRSQHHQRLRLRHRYRYRKHVNPIQSQPKPKPKPTKPTSPKPTKPKPKPTSPKPKPKPTSPKPKPKPTSPKPTLSKDESNTYYKSPDQMTARQRFKFRYKVRFENMTVQDYRNWLGLFKTDHDLKQSPQHLRNWRLIKSGNADKLTTADIPMDLIPPPANAEVYYQKLLNENIIHKLSIPYPRPNQDLDLIPANTGDYAEFVNSTELRQPETEPLPKKEKLAKQQSIQRGDLNLTRSQISKKIKRKV
jgi:hypothetical protein